MGSRDTDAALMSFVDTILNSYEPRWLLTDRGWTADEFTAWLADTLRHALLR
jgi:hypothetical protein